MLRDQAGKNAADHAAERQIQIERSQIARRRAAPGEFAVAHQREHEEAHQIERDQNQDLIGRAERERDDQQDHGAAAR